MIKKILFCSVLVLCLLSTFLISRNIQQKYTNITVEKFVYLPSGQSLKRASLGFNAMLSDVLWIRTIMYFEQHTQTDHKYPWLRHMLNVVTVLDPYSRNIYEVGGAMLASDAKDIIGSTFLLKKGMKNISKTNQRYWYLPFLIAFNYFYYEHDYKDAARYLAIAAKFPQRPKFIPLLVARLYANANETDVALPFLFGMLKQTTDVELKQKLAQRINSMINQKNIEYLKKAHDRFVLKFHRYPYTLKEIVKQNIISSIPIDPRGGRYYLSEDKQLIRNTKKSEYLKIYSTPLRTVSNVINGLINTINLDQQG